MAAAPWTHVAGGAYRVKGPTGPVGWTPPPLPSGSYNPLRDIETEEAQRGLGESEGTFATRRSRDLADYAAQKAAIERREGEQTQDYNTAKSLLGESFKRLAGRQGEQANTSGVLSGGAVLQSAAKRAANESREAAKQTTAFEREKGADTEALANLARELAPPDATNPLGGRALQDIATQEANARANNAFFAESQQRLGGAEAEAAGYSPPPVPASVLAQRARERERAGGVRPGITWGPSGTFVRVGAH